MLTLDKNSKEEDYGLVYSQLPGYVFKYSDNYETVVLNLQKFKPNGGVIEIQPIMPGTDLYTDYGTNHIVVTKNTLNI